MSEDMLIGYRYNVCKCRGVRTVHSHGPQLAGRGGSMCSVCAMLCIEPGMWENAVHDHGPQLRCLPDTSPKHSFRPKQGQPVFFYLF